MSSSSAGNALWGQGGDDTINGRTGADWLNGGAGTDTADYSLRTKAVTPLPRALTTFDEATDYRRSPDGSRFVFGADVPAGRVSE